MAEIAGSTFRYALASTSNNDESKIMVVYGILQYSVVLVGDEHVMPPIYNILYIYM